MWFKTRVGLLSLDGPIEILAYRAPDAASWSIYAKLKAFPEGENKGPFTSSKFWSPSSYLALFTDGPDVQKEIGEVMQRIASALASGEAVCDLSMVGQANAWKKEWVQIAWPTG